MRRSKALVIVTSQIKHVCPYKSQDQILALCYKRAQDIEERDFCYACDHVQLVLKRKYGLRTFRRRVRFATCRNCGDAVTLHASEAPFKGLRDTRCQGFEPETDSGVVWVALDQACTQWMVVDVVTGERLPLADYKHDNRYRMPLVGAPGTVPSDWRDEMRLEAAAFASARRMPVKKTKDNKTDDEASGTTVRVKGARRRRR